MPDRQPDKSARGGPVAPDLDPVPTAIRQAAKLAAAATEAKNKGKGKSNAQGQSGTVTVVATVRIHGSALGAPHPGLLPIERERDQGRRAVAAAVAALEKLGTPANGHILVTRAPGRAIARTARDRGAHAVLVAVSEPRGLRALIEGSLTAQLRRRLRDTATVEAVEEGVH